MGADDNFEVVTLRSVLVSMDGEQLVITDGGCDSATYIRVGFVVGS